MSSARAESSAGTTNCWLLAGEGPGGQVMVGASRGLSRRRPCALTGSLCPPKPQSGEGGTKASAAEIAFARFSFGVRFSLPITLLGEMGASAARHRSILGTPLGATAPPRAPSLRTRGVLLNSRGIKHLHIHISRKHVLKLKGNCAVRPLVTLPRVELSVQTAAFTRATRGSR